MLAAGAGGGPKIVGEVAMSLGVVSPRRYCVAAWCDAASDRP
jgi:hypothetical protein